MGAMFTREAMPTKLQSYRRMYSGRRTQMDAIGQRWLCRSEKRLLHWVEAWSNPLESTKFIRTWGLERRKNLLHWTWWKILHPFYICSFWIFILRVYKIIPYCHFVPCWHRKFNQRQRRNTWNIENPPKFKNMFSNKIKDQALFNRFQIHVRLNEYISQKLFSIIKVAAVFAYPADQWAPVCCHTPPWGDSTQKGRSEYSGHLTCAAWTSAEAACLVYQTGHKRRPRARRLTGDR